MTKYTYKVIEENEDPYAQIIEKGNISAKFTFAEMKAEQQKVDKTMEQIDAQRRIHDAECKNIEDHHPEVLDVDPEHRSHLCTYHMAIQNRSEQADLLKIYKDAKKEIAEEMAIIMKELDIPEVVNISDLANDEK
jgi:flagellar biosynthesis component FlhA